MDPAGVQALANNASTRRRAASLRRRAVDARTRSVAIGTTFRATGRVRLAQLSAGCNEASRQPKDEPLSKLTRAAIRAGRIPTSAGDHTRRSQGRGTCCVICGEPISPQQTDIAIEFAHDGMAPSVEIAHLHIKCCAAWDVERIDVDG